MRTRRLIPGAITVLDGSLIPWEPALEPEMPGLEIIIQIVVGTRLSNPLSQNIHAVFSLLSLQ